MGIMKNKTKTVKNSNWVELSCLGTREILDPTTSPWTNRREDYTYVVNFNKLNISSVERCDDRFENGNSRIVMNSGKEYVVCMPYDKVMRKING